MARGDAVARGAAVVVGLVVLVFSAWATLVALLFVGFAAQAPDAFVPDGDPCCPTPDTWAEVVHAAGAASVVVAAVASLFALVFALALHAMRRQWPRWKLLVRFPAIAVGLLAAVLGIAWASDEPRLRTDCSSFVFRSEDWRGSADSRLRTADAIARCGLINGKRVSKVAELLGQPTSKGAAMYEPPADTFWLYGDVGNARASDTDSSHDLTVFIRRDQVTDTRFSANCC